MQQKDIELCPWTRWNATFITTEKGAVVVLLKSAENSRQRQTRVRPNRGLTAYCVTPGHISETFLAAVTAQQIRGSCSYSLG